MDVTDQEARLIFYLAELATKERHDLDIQFKVATDHHGLTFVALRWFLRSPKKRIQNVCISSQLYSGSHRVHAYPHSCIVDHTGCMHIDQ
jgi:hypothetical protein